MTWERLKAHLDSIARIDADSLYAEFQRETGSQDLARLLGVLDRSWWVAPVMGTSDGGEDGRHRGRGMFFSFLIHKS